MTVSRIDRLAYCLPIILKLKKIGITQIKNTNFDFDYSWAHTLNLIL